jgi:hypothetical protein
MEDGIVDRLVVAVSYAYDRGAEMATRMGLDRVAMGVAAAGVAWGAMALEAAHAADQAHDAAVQLGMTTEEYTRWAYVVERTGGQVEHLRVGLTSLQRQLGAARAGNEQAADAFGSLGLGAEVASGKLGTAADALPRVLAGLAEIEDDGKRAAVAMQLLGEAGPRMAGLIAQGADGIAMLTARADALGATITDDVVDPSGDLIDALEDIGIYARGVSRDVGFALVPALAKAATGTRDWLVANDAIIDQQLDRTVGALGDAISRALDEPVGRAALAAGALAVAWGNRGAAGAMATAVANAIPLVGTLGRAALAGGPFVLVALAGAAALDDFAIAADGGDAAILRLAASMGVESEAQEAISSTRDLLYEAADAAWMLSSVMGEALAVSIEEIINLIPSLEPLREFVDTIRGGIGGALEDFGDRNDRAVSGFRKFGRYVAGDPGVEFGGRRTPDEIQAGFRDDVNAGVGGAIVQSVVGAPLSVVVNVAAGPTIQQIADAAAEEVRRQVLAAVDATGTAQ